MPAGPKIELRLRANTPVKNTSLIICRAFSKGSISADVFLSPALVKSAIEGTLPYGVGITQFIEPRLNWNDQLAMLR